MTITLLYILKRNTIHCQVPWLPELFALSEDLKLLEDVMTREAGLTGEELEAYKYSYRNYQAWRGALNLYRASFSKKSAEFWSSEEMKRRIRNIRVRTLQIFGTADAYLTEAAARASHKFVPDHQLRLLEGVSHWVQHQQPHQVNTIIKQFLDSR